MTGEITKENCMPDSPIKVKFSTYVSNGGDGSVHVLCFRTKEEAEAYADGREERLDDDIQTHYLEFDDNGVLLNGTKQ